MEKEDMQKMEERFILYFKYRSETESMYSRIVSLTNQLNEIDSDARSIRDDIEFYNSRREKDNEKVEYIFDDEEELKKTLTFLEKERQNKGKVLIKTKKDLRERECYLKEVEYIMSCLDEIEQDFINLKYNKKKKMSTISVELGVGLSTLYRKKKNISAVVKDYFEESYRLKFGA